MPQEQEIVSAISTIFNKDGQLNLFFEKPLKDILNTADFGSLEDCSYSMFKLLLSQHL
jgi:hypothetical protein